MRPFPRLAWAAAALALAATCPLAAEVPTSPEAVTPLLEGAEIPAVTLTAADGSAVGLRSAISNKPALIIFYRGGW